MSACALLMADPLLYASGQEVVYLFLGAAILTVGLVSAALLLLRRRFDPILFWFALFALLYGGRLWWMRSGLLAALISHGTLLSRLRDAVDYLVPIPAFFYFRAAGYLNRFGTYCSVPLAAVMLCLTAAVLAMGPSQRLHDINDAAVIASLLLLLSQVLWGRGRTRELRIVRLGLLAFIAAALWDNVTGLLRFYLDLEPFGFVIFLAALGYVGVRRMFDRDTELAAVRTELGVAEGIQRSILPVAFPESPHFRVAARYVPMRSVAGDFYDFSLADGGEAGLLIADVSGHGVPAALIASMVKMAAASQRAQASDPAALLAGMNGVLCGNTQSQYVTAAYVYLDAGAAELRYAAAAHPPMLLVRAGQVQEIAENGLMLGVFDTAAYITARHALEPGDRMLLYTDGLLEAANAAGEEFGRDRLHDVLRETQTLSHEAAVDLILAKVRGWAATQEDDMTALICDYQGA